MIKHFQTHLPKITVAPNGGGNPLLVCKAANRTVMNESCYLMNKENTKENQNHYGR